MVLLREDSRLLVQAFTEIRNEMTGIGTERDKSTLASINMDGMRLPDTCLQNLPRISGIVRRAVFLHVNYGFRGRWFRIKSGVGEDTAKLHDYMKGIKGDLRSQFRRCAALGRQKGDGYILLGIDDGRRPDEPVDEGAIRSVRWMRAFTSSEVKIEYDASYIANPHEPEYYRLYPVLGRGRLPDVEENGLIRGNLINDFLWHKSRVIRISGDYLYDEALRDMGGCHDSVIQAMFNAWVQWSQGIAASSAMLQDYDEFTLGIKGLGQLVNPEGKTEEQAKAAQEKIVQRALTLDLGRSVARGMLYDLEGEKPGTITRSYSGADQIMERLEGLWAAVSGVPKFKLFNIIGSTGIATGVQAAIVLKYEWGIQVQEWLEDSTREGIERLTRYCAIADDSEVSENGIDSLEIEFPLNVILSPLEQAELQKMVAERDEKNIKSGIYTGLEARQIYERNEFDLNLNLEPMEVERGESKRVLVEMMRQTGKPKVQVLRKNQIRQDRGELIRIDDATPTKAVIKWQGLEIGIQYFPLEKRHGKRLQAAYGHIRRSHSPEDGMAIDCYFLIGSNSTKIFEIEQIINGQFDEYKYVIGANSREHARDIYLASMPKDFLGQIKKVDIDYLKQFFN